jgi:hypothetical protein
MEAASPVGINTAPTSFSPPFPNRAPVLTSARGEFHVDILSPYVALIPAAANSLPLTQDSQAGGSQSFTQQQGNGSEGVVDKVDASLASSKLHDGEKRLHPDEVDLGSALQKLWSVITSSVTGD